MAALPSYRPETRDWPMMIQMISSAMASRKAVGSARASPWNACSIIRLLSAPSIAPAVC